MDGLFRNKRVFVIGATNRRDMLDSALLRGGRLSREIEIPVPDEAARRALFVLCTASAKLDDDVDLDRLTSATPGFTGANIKALVNDAGLQALIRIADSGPTGIRRLTLNDFLEALSNFPAPAEEPSGPWRLFA
jgi:transitional endoplasmic reticulum ATPase